jgi:apolipoprotein N-acyltransferase
MTIYPFQAAPIDPVKIAKWTGQVRLVLTLLAGVGIGGAWIPHITDAQISGYVGLSLALIPIGSALWSWFENEWNRKKANATVVASAVASAAMIVPLVVVPAASYDEPNATTTRRVTSAEANAATAVVQTPT